MANVNNNSNANNNNNNDNNNNNNNNNINMNMNTGRTIPDNIIINPGDIWSLENLEHLIDLRVDGCSSDEEGQHYPDSINLRPGAGATFTSSSCVAFRKMMLFSMEALKLHF